MQPHSDSAARTQCRVHAASSTDDFCSCAPGTCALGYDRPAESPAAYIVESTITGDTPAVDEPIFRSEATFPVLRPEFGFVVVVWSPSTPSLVREFHWNTAEERRRDPNMVGRIVERKATEREKREGERQHEEATVEA